MSRAAVALVSTTPETIAEDIRRGLVLADLKSRVAEGRRWVVAADLAWRSPFPGANTTPWQLEGAIQALRAEHLATDQIQVLAVGPGAGTAPWQAQRFASVLQRHGVTSTSREGLERIAIEENWVTLQTLFPEGMWVPKALLEADLFVLPTITTHVSLGVGGGLAAAVSALFGAVAVPRRLYPGLVADSLKLLTTLRTRVFTLLDGTVCGEGAGPRTIRPSVQNVLVASGDPVAADAIAARVMGLDPHPMPLFRRCLESGLGAVDPGAIDLRGESLGDVGSVDLPRAGAAVWLEQVASGRGGAARRVSRAVQDTVWFPLVGRSVRRRYARTPWGRLHSSYRAETNR